MSQSGYDDLRHAQASRAHVRAWVHAPQAHRCHRGAGCGRNPDGIRDRL